MWFEDDKINKPIVQTTQGYPKIGFAGNLIRLLAERYTLCAATLIFQLHSCRGKTVFIFFTQGKSIISWKFEQQTENFINRKHFKKKR